MITEPELLNERLERLAMVLDEIMPNCALLVRDALELLKEQEKQIKNRDELLEKAREEIKWFQGMLKEQQEAVEPRKCQNEDSVPLTEWWYVCGICDARLHWGDGYCSRCGRKVKWK